MECFMFRSSLVFVALSVSTIAPVIGQEKTFSRRNGNEIVVTNFSSRDLAGGELPVSKLKEEWNTDNEIRWDLASYLSVLSEQCYSDDDETLDFLLRGMGFTQWVSVKNKTMAAHVVSGEGIAVVIFRGTDFTEIPDWYKNLTMTFVETPHGRFHKGFNEAYESVKVNVRQNLSEVRPSKIWITGHSLGGAMALACGADLKQHTNIPASLVTFGQPRFADEKGARWFDREFDGRYARFVHGVDVVPSVPPYVRRFLPYAHAGNLVAISEDGITLSESTTAIPLALSSYCGTCGRATMQAQVPIYQPINEPPPLTQTEYEQSLHTLTVVVPNRAAPGYAQDTLPQTEFKVIPDIFADHFMEGYRTLIRRYRDGQAMTQMPSR